jgi:hypothetical protein
MDKLDRLGWAAGLSFRSYGLRIGVRVNRLRIPDDLMKILPPGWQPASTPTVDALYSLWVASAEARSGTRKFNIAYTGARRIGRTETIEEALTLIESHMHLLVAEWARRHVFVHAGAVGWKGGAVVIPGKSCTGKSTLVEALVRAGATYYSDEYAVIDRDGYVHPFATDIKIREAPGVTRRRSIRELGGNIGKCALPVAMIVVTKYRPGSRWQPQCASPGHAVLALLENTVAARRTPARALRALSKASRRATCLQSSRDEALEVATDILQRAESIPELERRLSDESPRAT